MANPQKMRHCSSCERQTVHLTSGGTNHVLHLILTIVSVFVFYGVWLVVWIACAAGTKKAHCTACGTGGATNHVQTGQGFAVIGIAVLLLFVGFFVATP